MKLDIQLHRYHIAVRLLDKHCHLVINNKGLSSFVIAVHEFRMFLPYQLWHECFNTIAKYFLFSPAKKHAKTIVDLDNLSKLCSVSINNNKISQV